MNQQGLQGAQGRRAGCSHGTQAHLDDRYTVLAASPTASGGIDRQEVEEPCGRQGVKHGELCLEDGLAKEDVCDNADVLHFHDHIAQPWNLDLELLLSKKKDHTFEAMKLCIKMHIYIYHHIHTHVYMYTYAHILLRIPYILACMHA